MEYHIEIHNLQELQRDFAKAPQLYDREVSRAINSSLNRYQATAKTLSPVDTGRLRSSISMFPAQRNGNVIEGSVRTGTHYAVYQELGTSRGVRPRLSMKGSVDANQEHTDRAFEQAADNITHELAGRRAA